MAASAPGWFARGDRAGRATDARRHLRLRGELRRIEPTVIVLVELGEAAGEAAVGCLQPRNVAVVILVERFEAGRRAARAGRAAARGRSLARCARLSVRRLRRGNGREDQARDERAGADRRADGSTKTHG